MVAALQNPVFTDDNAAREALEAIRWQNGPVCVHCGSVEKLARITTKSARPGLIYCCACKKQFTVTVGTIFEHSKVSLSKWWFACYLMGSSKKGMSAHQLHRMLGVTYKTAWFMEHRIREAMRTGSFVAPMGGAGAVVEVDETFIGTNEGKEKKRGHGHKNAVLTLVERGKGSRSFHVSDCTADTIMPILKTNITAETRVMTDEAGQYIRLDQHFAQHGVTKHSADEYVRSDIHSNTFEGFLFSLQARHEGRVSTLRREASAPLRGRI